MRSKKTNQRPVHRTLAAGALAVTVALTLSACGGEGSKAVGDSGDAKGTVTLGFPGGVGPTDVPAILALEALKADGWSTDYIEFDSPDVQTQALLRGDINVASMGPATVMSANIAGADLRMVATNNRNDLQIVVAPDIDSCADLDGKPVAYHSEGSTSTAHLREWLNETCPDAKPEFLVISGSGNRVTALMQGQIAGTIVRLEDWQPAIKETPDGGKILASLGETQPKLLTQTIVATEKGIDSDEGAHEAFLNALEREFEKLHADPVDYGMKAALVLKDEDEAGVGDLYSALAEGDMFPDGIELDEDKVNATINFYQASGTIPEGELTAADLSDTRFADK